MKKPEHIIGPGTLFVAERFKDKVFQKTQKLLITQKLESDEIFEVYDFLTNNKHFYYLSQETMDNLKTKGTHKIYNSDTKLTVTLTLIS